MQVADYLISSGRCAQLDIEVGMCEQDTRIEEVVLRAVQRLGFGFANTSVLPYAYDELRGCRGSIVIFVSPLLSLMKDQVKLV